jgi:diaminopimelate epimerase
MKFTKYQALGNDYLVIEPQELPGLPGVSQIRRICDRHYGAGSDGILLGPLPSEMADFGLRIFNPDGSEAEKSGNGLRIFARHLWESGRVEAAPHSFSVQTRGGTVRCQVTVPPKRNNGSMQVKVEMGRVSFDSQDILVSGPPRQVINETLQIGGEKLVFCAATLGNPHCVVLRERVSAAEAIRLGPLIEHHAAFPRRTNVQFMQTIDQGNIRIEIWERGAGYTLASGSSSCAAAAVAHRLGLCGTEISVLAPGGRLAVSLSPDWQATLTGPVRKVYTGEMAL